MQIYRVSFINHGKIYELYVQAIRQAELFGFVEFEEIIFNESSGVVIDPAEEKLKAEFAGVTRTMVPMNAVIRIDEVEKRGTSKILDLDKNANVTPFPSPVSPPDRGSNL
jgi:hypothetical protein